MRVAVGKRLVLLGVALLLVVGAALAGKTYWDSEREAGYVAFNAGRFADARESLSFIAQLGDPYACRLMAYMSGLGLGGPVDVAEAVRWMAKSAPAGSDARAFIGEQAYNLGKDAVDGLYGSEKVEVGRLWLQMADLSGSKKASPTLEK